MDIKVLVMFPYSGFSSGDSREEIFWEMIDKVLQVDGRPIVIINRDTERRGRCDAFFENPRSKTDVEQVSAWSTDTCQMWLAGWGYVIDNMSCERVVLLPGDLDVIRDKSRFFANLKGFLQTGGADIVIGDFVSESRFSAKELIDTYGTYPLLANWFDEVSRAITELPLLKPRSEFLNVKVDVLKELLCYRKFAYEQTLNMLIRSWSFKEGGWKFDIGIHVLGDLQDDKAMRQYRDTLDQIERTERMLRLLWREIHEPKQCEFLDNAGNEDNKAYKDAYIEFIAKYHRLDITSGAIRDSARTTMRTLLGA